MGVNHLFSVTAGDKAPGFLPHDVPCQRLQIGQQFVGFKLGADCRAGLPPPLGQQRRQGILVPIADGQPLVGGKQFDANRQIIDVIVFDARLLAANHLAEGALLFQREKAARKF